MSKYQKWGGKGQRKLGLDNERLTMMLIQRVSVIKLMIGILPTVSVSFMNWLNDSNDSLIYNWLYRWLTSTCDIVFEAKQLRKFMSGFSSYLKEKIDVTITLEVVIKQADRYFVDKMSLLNYFQNGR